MRLLDSRSLDVRARRRALFVLLAAIGSAVGCGGSDGPTVIPVTSIKFAAQPTNIAAGEPFSVTVHLLGAEAQVATSATDPVTLTLNATGTITGPATVNAAAGVATFSGLSVTQAGASVQLIASSGGLTTSSAPFVIRPGAPVADRSTVSAVPNVPTNSPTPVTFTFKDVHGNAVTSAPISLTTSLAGSTFTPSSGTTNGGGSFTSSFSSTVEGSATFAATVAGVLISFSTPAVVLDICPQIPMTFPGTTNGALPSGSCVIAGRPSSLYRFTMPAAGGAAFAATSAFQPLLEVKATANGTEVQLSQTQTFTFEWLLPSGTFFYRIGAVSGGGPFSIVGTTVPANRDSIERYLVTGGTYGGQTLQTGDFQFGDGSFLDIFYFRSPLPCTLRLSSTAFRPYFIVADAVTFEGPNDVTTAVGVDAVFNLPACQFAGGNPMIIITNSFAAGETGPYTLTVTLQGGATYRANGRADAPAWPIAIGKGALEAIRARIQKGRQ